MLRNLSKHYLFICCKQSSSTHFCHYLATAFVTDVLAGSNPMHRAQAKTVPLRGPFPILWWAMRDVRVRLAPPASRFVAPLLACCAGKRLRVSSAPHPAGFESRHMDSKKARHREGNGLLVSNGAPSGIRTRDIHLERVASLAARRWGQRERV